MRLICALLLGALSLLLPSLADAQIKPSGSSFTPGHTARVMNPQGTVLGDAGGAAGSSLPGQNYLTELGITNTGTPMCINDALTNATGGYHAFCVGANAGGTGVISFNAFRGAATLPLVFNVNGVNYPFPFSVGGVVGPGTTVVNELASFANTTGNLLRQGRAQLTDNLTAPMTADAASLTVFSHPPPPTANSIYRMSTNAPVNNYDVIRAVATTVAGSTVTNVTGLAGYVEANAALGSGATSNSAVGLFSVGVAAADSAAVWGINTVATDNTAYAVSAGTNRTIQNEYDFNVTSPNTVVHGGFLAGASLAQMAAGSDGWSCRISGTGFNWPTCFISTNGSAVNGLVIGALSPTPTPNNASQNLLFGFFDSASVQDNYNLHVNTTQQLELSSNLGINEVLLIDGLVRTLDSSGDNPNAFQAGAQAASGTNIASQFILWKYFNSAGAAGNVAAQVTSAQALSFIGAASYQFDQLVRTADGNINPNAFGAGALAASGTNIGSQFISWHYFNGAGASANAAANVTNAQILSFTGAASYRFDTTLNVVGGYFINGVIGVTCSAPPTAAWRSVGGIVTAC